MVNFCYQNDTKHMVVLRCIGSKQFYLERVIFPFESLDFEAPDGSKVEIWGNHLYGPKLEERIRVSSLRLESALAA